MKDDSELSSVFLTPPNIPRRETSSAPPAIQLDPETLFAFQTNYWRVFSDIRCDENYANFYHAYGDKTLPAPLEEPTFLKRDDFEEEELMKRMMNERYQQVQDSPAYARAAVRQLQFEQQQQFLQQQQQQQQQQRYAMQLNNHNQYAFQNGDHFHHPPMPAPVSNGNGVPRNDVAYRVLHGNAPNKHDPLWNPMPKIASLSSDDFNLEEVFLPNIDSDSEFSSSTEDLGSISSPTPTRLNPPMVLDRYFADGTQKAPQQFPNNNNANPNSIWDGERGYIGHKLPTVPQVKSNFAPAGMQQIQSQQLPTLKTPPAHPMAQQISPRGMAAAQQQQQQVSPRGPGASPRGPSLSPRHPQALPQQLQQPIPQQMMPQMPQQLAQQIPQISQQMAQQIPQQMAQPVPALPLVSAPVATRAADMARFYQQHDDRPPGAHQSPTPQSQPTSNGSDKKRTSPPPGLQAGTPSPRSVSPGQVSPRPAVCRYYLQGYCSRGDRCNFLHDAPQSEDTTALFEPPKPEASPDKADAKQGKSRGRNNKNETARYTTIEQVIGQIYPLCKDQHGCRFLQKKLEEQNPKIVEIIFTEVYDHMVVLMTDPFGNYLCQKLLEYCTEQQRTGIIEKVAPELVTISKNMHGTRAVQKMIEYINSPVQINLIRTALRSSVVALIQDLNGNHVIQRCLNKLSPEDNQFIYDAVAGHCVEVATHRHGCCVLQRCIDHASDSQKVQLFQEISLNALTLVQDPYGNYVVQYVLELPFPQLVDGLIRRFLGHLVTLSTQKFSSNVMEKCLHAAPAQTRNDMAQELAEGDSLGVLLQDPFANYVIQTALGVADQYMHDKLVDAIKPHLTALRNTPYGKRIQNKLAKDSTDKRQLEL